MNETPASKLIENCVIASGWILPASEITNTPEIYKLRNLSSPYEFHNGIYRTQLTENGDIDNELRAHYESFISQNLNFRWYRFPHSLPDQLDAKLQKLGPHTVTELSGLVCDVAGFNSADQSDVTVEEVTLANVDDYARASNEAWGQTGDAAARIAREMRYAIEHKSVSYRSFLARYKGEPASTGMFRIVDGAGYLFGGSTATKFRKKGIYGALVGARIKVLRDLNISRCLILARKATSAPICMKLGFRHDCDVRSFDFTARP